MGDGIDEEEPAAFQRTVGKLRAAGPARRRPGTVAGRAGRRSRTSAAELAAQGVHMRAVDTGRIADENPAPKKARMAGAGFRTPLDIVDGAARVYDPVVRGEAGDPVSGVLLKDCREAEW